jgi:hypothetical protein
MAECRAQLLLLLLHAGDSEQRKLLIVLQKATAG